MTTRARRLKAKWRIDRSGDGHELVRVHTGPGPVCMRQQVIAAVYRLSLGRVWRWTVSLPGPILLIEGDASSAAAAQRAVETVIRVFAA